MQSGVVVAGGYSTRFAESDKAVAELADTPLIRRVVDRLAGIVDELVINCRVEQRPAIADAMAGLSLTRTYALDETPDRGPLAGISQGLSAATGEYVAVVACDMPFVEPELLRELFERAEGTDGAVPRVDGYLQPLQAVYRRDPMCRLCEAALDRGERRIHAVLDNLDCVIVGESELDSIRTQRSFENLNTPEEFAAAAARLDDGH
jgi:molybdopterin-guanine dinucleotide biosynthesis protein A